MDKKAPVTSQDRDNLKKANQDYTTCISQDFLTRFLQGESVKVEDFCVKEREAMMKLD